MYWNEIAVLQFRWIYNKDLWITSEKSDECLTADCFWSLIVLMNSVQMSINWYSEIVQDLKGELFWGNQKWGGLIIFDIPSLTFMTFAIRKSIFEIPKEFSYYDE